MYLSTPILHQAVIANLKSDRGTGRYFSESNSKMMAKLRYPQVF